MKLHGIAHWGNKVYNLKKKKKVFEHCNYSFFVIHIIFEIIAWCSSLENQTLLLKKKKKVFENENFSFLIIHIKFTYFL